VTAPQACGGRDALGELHSLGWQARSGARLAGRLAAWVRQVFVDVPAGHRRSEPVQGGLLDLADALGAHVENAGELARVRSGPSRRRSSSP
jgi:hypothetical protein